jgi:predicted XRE-type DNA-binding protein
VKPKCLETRRDGLLTKRTYLLPNGRRVRTMEIPLSVWSHVKHSATKRLAAYEQAEAARDRTHQIKQLLLQGHKQEYIASVVGVIRQRVSAVKATMKKETK